MSCQGGRFRRMCTRFNGLTRWKGWPVPSMLLMVNSTHPGSGPVQGTSWWWSQVSRSRASSGRLCASQVVWLIKPFGILASWFSISIAVYIIKCFWASGSRLVSGIPFAPRRLKELTSVWLFGVCRISDSVERRKDWVGVRAKLGRKKYLMLLDAKKRGEEREYRRYRSLLPKFQP